LYLKVANFVIHCKLQHAFDNFWANNINDLVGFIVCLEVLGVVLHVYFLHHPAEQVSLMLRKGLSKAHSSSISILFGATAFFFLGFGLEYASLTSGVEGSSAFKRPLELRERVGSGPSTKRREWGVLVLPLYVVPART
jgi:hypothetical protein